MIQKRFKRFIGLILGMITMGLFAPGHAQQTKETAYNTQVEITGKRSESAKIFKISDGSYRAQVFGGAVHYQDNNEQWQDINTTVQQSADPAYQFENTTNGIKSYFPNTLASHGVKVVSKQGAIEMGNQFTFSLDAALDAPVADNAIKVDLNGATASSPGANIVRYDGGHALGYVEYLVDRNQVKQQFILKQLPAAAANSSARYFSMSETIDLPQGWSLLANGTPVTTTASTQGALQIRNAKGKVVSGIPIPEIFEQKANGSILNPDGKMAQSFFVQRVTGTNQYLIKISIPLTWLQEPVRSFPIVIDPNSVLSGGWGGWIDGVQTVNGNPSTFVFVGALSGTDHLAYTQFSLAAIPDSVQIDSVLLSLRLNNQASSSTSVLMEVNDVNVAYGPYNIPQSQDSAYLDDFNNGTYISFSTPNMSAGFYPALNLGSQGADDVRLSLCTDTFQVALVNNNQSWKRFSSGLNFIDVYYKTCTGVAPTVIETAHQDKSCNNILGSSTVVATGNSTFYWAHNGDTSGTQTNLAPGNYGVFVNSTSGCGAVLCITILSSPTIGATITTTNASCVGNTDGMASAVGTGGAAPYTFLWSTSDTTSSISGLSPATYSVIVSDSNGCTDSTSFTIGSPSAVTVSTNSSNASCNGLNDGSASASASGGTGGKTFVWSSGDTTATASNLLAGTYYVTATDSNGCTATDSVTVSEPTGFTISNNASAMISCNGLSNGAVSTSVTSGTGSFTYLWSNSGTTSSIVGLSAGTYSVTVTNSNTGCFKIDSTVIIEPTVLLTGVVGSNVLCNGLNDGTAISTTSGGVGPYSYLWSNSDSTASITSLAAGTYSVIATDSNGCTAVDSVTISEPTLLIATATGTDASCNGLADGTATTTTAGGTGSTTFLWSNAATTASIMGLSAATYTVIATDSNGCTASDTITVAEPAAIDVSVSQNGNALSANLNGATYQWLDCNNAFAVINGETSQTFTATGTGNYAVEITENGCIDTSACTLITIVGTDAALTSQEGFTIFPNPSTGRVVIRIEGTYLEEQKISVFSMTGRRVAEQVLGNTDNEIDFTYLSDGVYVVQYRNQMKKLVLRK